MPRQLPPGALAAMMAPETSFAFIYLLTITTSAPLDLRFTNNSVDVSSSVSGSPEVYTRLPFDIVLASHEEGKLSEARLTLDNVSRTLIDDIRSQAEALKVRIDIVSTEDVDTLVASFQDTVLRNVSYDALSITGSLVTENLKAENFSQLMTGRYYPALFISR
jgi:hypothetical protein